MKRILITLSLLTAITACKGPEQPPIDTVKMGRILTDIQLAEVYSSMVDDSLHRVMPKNQDSLARYYKQVFASHNITQEEFETAINWYKSNPEQLDTVYKNIVANLTVQDGMLQAGKEN